MKEAVLVIIKPDGMKRSLIGLVITKISKTDLQLIGAKLKKVDNKLAKAHYIEFENTPFFPDLIDYFTGKIHGTDLVLALVYYGENAVSKVREICGDKNPSLAKKNTIRGKFGKELPSGIFANVIHVSKTREDAEREIKLWFNPDEIFLI